MYICNILTKYMISPFLKVANGRKPCLPWYVSESHVYLHFLMTVFPQHCPSDYGGRCQDDSSICLNT